ncbi:MAG: alpha-N-arabinofuranosidase [Luteitalea sp.]|nr:alpha-N-arabinofuranosidase [Luteitalea sp.]
MKDLPRRRFLKQTLGSATVLASGSLLSSLGYAQSRSERARIFVNTRRGRAPLDRKILGAFLEHLGRAVYGGVYEPNSPLADEHGFRRDVLEEVRSLGVPIMRYPGGNFVSGHNWLDGVGPKKDRPTVIDRAWNSIETNQFGTNEFMEWCRAIGSEPLLACNLGTGTPEDAAHLTEYCNVERGTRWSDLRREHGYDQPHRVKYWCLGNEMDGPWQIGHMTAREYGRKARDAARQIRAIDPDTQLIACGSSNNMMPTYLVWDREMLEECYDEVDAISLHNYYGNTAAETGDNSSHFVALNLDMEQQIQEIIAVCDYVRGLQRSDKSLWLSFDEWNVWYRARSGDAVNGRKQHAPPLLEEVYNLEDALLVGGFVNTLLRQAERVRLGCLAQIVNVIAPLRTNKEKTIRQTIYFPYAWALQYAHGTVLDLYIESPSYEIDRRGYLGDVRRRMSAEEMTPYIDATATWDAKEGRLAVFLLNRDLERERDIELSWLGATPTKVLAAQTLSGEALKASNTFEAPETVRPQNLETPRPADNMTFRLPARSYTVLQLATA